LRVQAFYAFAVVYLAIALWAAHRTGRRMPGSVDGQPGRSGLDRSELSRSGLRRQHAILVAVLAAGLLWPALVASLWDDPSIG
jgi:hypothetical protein